MISIKQRSRGGSTRKKTLPATLLLAWFAASSIGGCAEEELAPARKGDRSLGTPGANQTNPGATPSGDGGAGPDGAPGSVDGGGPSGPVLAVDQEARPLRIDDALTNPGMGLANFHFGWWCDFSPAAFSVADCAKRIRDHWPANHPPSGTAYFRWTWKQLEPVRGQIDFAMIDAALQTANALGETLGFRVMTIEEGGAGVPAWLLQEPYSVPTIDFSGTAWPDYRAATFLSEHARFLAALGARYAGHPALDHVDIGTVGCWGEWNTACLAGGGGLFGVFGATSATDKQVVTATYKTMIDHHVSAFSGTPLLMLGLGEADEIPVLLHATQRGAGWRVDCWGDYGIFGAGWNHMDNLYPSMIAAATAADPAFSSLWKKAPIHLEVCATLPDWETRGWTAVAPDGQVHKSFQFAAAEHASVLNTKFTAIPTVYGPALADLLKKNGYRFGLDALRHPKRISVGATMRIESDWSNLGVAPSYGRRALSYRLRGASTEITLTSAADPRTWLPGTSKVSDEFVVPELPAGDYAVEVALLDRPGSNPVTAPLAPTLLATAGRRADGWTPASTITVGPP